MKMRAVLLCALLSLSSVWGVESPQEIRVQLDTANPLSPLYIGKIGGQNKGFDAAYVNQLESVIAYDFKHNGLTALSARTTEKDAFLAKTDVKAAFHVPFWKQSGARFVVRFDLNGRSLQAVSLDTQKGGMTTFPEVLLKGDLSADRKQLHKLCDAMYKQFSGKEGIAATRILFAYQHKHQKADGSDWVSEIWECDWDGGNARQVTREESYCVTPVLVPHSGRFSNDGFLYVSYKNGQPKIYIGSLQGGSGKRLIDLRGNQLLPAISAQRDKIAFICDAGGRTDLFIQSFNPDTRTVGTPVQLYSYPRSTQASPTFSPDGSKLAFVSDKDGGMRIYLLSTTPSDKRNAAVMITKQNRENSCPCWSPDGTKLAYSAKTNGIRQIWIYDFVAQEERQLTMGPGNKENPCWAPNSQHLVFNSTDGDNSELYIANLNQPEAIKISKGPGKKHYPSWGIR